MIAGFLYECIIWLLTLNYEPGTLTLRIRHKNFLNNCRRASRAHADLADYIRYLLNYNLSLSRIFISAAKQITARYLHDDIIRTPIIATR